MLQQSEIRLINVLADWIERGRLVLQEAKMILIKEIEPERIKQAWKALLAKVRLAEKAIA